MNNRDLFLKIANFELTNVIFNSSWHQWYWADTIKRWITEGAPSEILIKEFRDEYFGMDRLEVLPIKSGLLGLGECDGPPYVPPFIPFFKRKILEENNILRTVIDESGVKYLEYVNQPERMPQWLDFPVKNKKDWNELKKRLDPDSFSRFPAYWKDKVKCWNIRDYPLGLDVGSLFGLLRSFVGLENLSILYYDDPNFVHEMEEYMVYFEIEIIKKVVKNLKIDFAFYWEDMAYKNGSLISAKIFREFMMPRYKKINDLLRKNNVNIILVDSDGNTEELIPLWIESGINGQYPLEVTSGMDAVKLRKQYDKNFILIGNIDKRCLAIDKESIRQEVLNKIPFLISKGGYFPVLDHFCPPDVSFENYKYYLNLLREISK